MSIVNTDLKADFARARQAYMDECSASTTDISTYEVAVTSSTKRTKKASALVLALKDGAGNATSKAWVLGRYVPCLSHLGPTGNLHSDEHGIRGDDRATIGTFSLERAKAVIFFEQSEEGSWGMFHEKCRSALREFFLDAKNHKTTAQFFSALAKKQEDDAYTTEDGCAWIKQWEEMQDTSFPPMKSVTKEYNDTKKVQQAFKTNIVWTRKSNDDARDCTRSWPATLHDVDTASLIDTAEYKYQPHVLTTMYKEENKVDPYVLYKLKEQKGVSIPVRVKLDIREMALNTDGTFAIRAYLEGQTVLCASATELKDPEYVYAAFSSTASDSGSNAEVGFVSLPARAVKRRSEKEAEHAPPSQRPNRHVKIQDETAQHADEAVLPPLDDVVAHTPEFSIKVHHATESEDEVATQPEPEN